MSNNELNKEIKFLNDSEILINELLEKYFENENKLDAFSYRRLNDLINRSFKSEAEFLNDDLKSYIELYRQDHNLN